MESLIFGIVLLVSIGYFFYRVNYLYSLLKFGQKENRFDNPFERLNSAVKNGLLQMCHFKVNDKDINYAGIMHALIFFGFVVLLFGEIELIIKGFIPSFSFSFLGVLYPIYLFLEDLFAFLVLVAIVMSLIRRFVWHPKKLNYHFSAYLILIFITILMLTLLYMAALEMAKANQINPYEPFASIVYRLLNINSYNELAYHIAFWVHMIVLLAFLDFIPNSKHLHILAGIPNNYFVNLGPSMALRDLNFEDENVESFGVKNVNELTWKQLLDGYACTECGRCAQVCPAANTNKVLVPREIILGIKENLFHNAQNLFNKKELIPIVTNELPKDNPHGYYEYGFTIPDKALWQCTTCGACQNVCPVGNEHIRDMIDLKRYAVLTQGEFPEKLVPIFNNIETNSNPWGINADYRLDWAKGLDVKTIDEVPDAEVLYFVGCASSFDDRSKKIAQSFVKVLQKANVKFAVLGKKEKCCGDNARRLGNEYLFYNLALENIETFKSYNVKKIVTTCPHGYYTLKNEYKKLGGEFEVLHHSQFIGQLLKEGRIKLSNKLNQTATFHDSCYLGRHSNIYQQPREILSQAGLKLSEMKNAFCNSFCCGAGGGMMWLEEEGTRMNKVRTNQAIDTSASNIVTACPFCMIMLDDGVKDLSRDDISVLDIAQVVEKSMA
ncbi:MAG: heterodisulfide reductase-related iron-sulfur binding cluster [Desulfurella sp.]|uniref:heterodisulfide reductase-related iron-sulfur binding cluster n=1 Tax=Desulfurella sp. TaxID=1962857 RepID=UPI0003E08722|nr:(Fe-S)-binding protein [Desulfurella sp.]AHF96827.1 Fe-S osidoreductase [Desulfurella acetivorans A63]PMP87519.1 MAG: 4Fe-4S dicluster domain-containing protein [Desulfurella sp.]HEX13578.1 4Fe-4S dicluster domain-containing protein [Desulfurella acetivorans]